MEIQNYQFSLEKTNAYLITEGNHGILVDPCSDELVNILNEKGVILDYVCLTHEHCDHLWGLNQVRDAFNCKLIATTAASAAIQSPRTNRAKEHHIYMTLRFGAEYSNESGTPDYFCKRAEIEYDDEFTLVWQGNRLFFKNLPGHSKGSCIIQLNDEFLISGDTLLKDEKTFTRFEGGDKDILTKTTLPYIMNYPDNIIVMPGHGERFRLGDYSFKDGLQEF